MHSSCSVSRAAHLAGIAAEADRAIRAERQVVAVLHSIA
jgi:hypothetical protein